MRLEDMTPAHVRRAVQLYLERAYPGEVPDRPARTAEGLEQAATIEELLALFDTPPAAQAPDFKRYTLQLGNVSYPFMKFVVEEYLVDEEYFFTVDTHDDLNVKPDSPDYAGWQAIKQLNRDLKDDVEDSWRAAGLPTFVELQHLCEGLGGVELEASKRRRLLLVDDERSVARGLRALLEGRGYDVDMAFSGEQVLERLRHDPLPDLILLDYELPHIDGGQVLDRLRADPRLRELPVLMVTAASIDLSQLRHVRGILRKPYPRKLLFKTLREILEPGGESKKA